MRLKGCTLTSGKTYRPKHSSTPPICPMRLTAPLLQLTSLPPVLLLHSISNLPHAPYLPSAPHIHRWAINAGKGSGNRLTYRIYSKVRSVRNREHMCAWEREREWESDGWCLQWRFFFRKNIMQPRGNNDQEELWLYLPLECCVMINLECSIFY